MNQHILSRNNVKVTGRGTQAIVFAHGFGCDQNMWRFVAPAFVKFRGLGVCLEIDLECWQVQHNSFRAIKDKYRYTDFARIVFSDNGSGFESRFSDYVFEVLRKLEPRTPGPGVGLAICRKVAENHNGSSSVDSEPGRGTRFTLLLPLRQ